MRARRALALTLAAVVQTACSTEAGEPSRHDAGGADAGGAEAVACRPVSGFTACVRACGEADMSEPMAAECVDGFYACAEPLIPAIACPDDAWPTGPFAGCGPWVTGHDCFCAAVCDEGLWTCPSTTCADGG